MLDGPVTGKNSRRLVANRALCLGSPDRKHVSGGAQLAAIVALLESASDRLCVQAAIQFRGSPKLGDIFDVQMTAIRHGKSFSQAGAQISSEGALLASAQATLSVIREASHYDQYVAVYDVPSADTCPPLPFIRVSKGDVHSLLDFRIATDRHLQSSGELLFWVRWGHDDPVPAAFLALIADFLPEAVHFAVGKPAGAISLDNSLRVVRRSTTDWLLCAVQLHAVSNMIFHGSMMIFDDERRLVATASQSGLVRDIAE